MPARLALEEQVVTGSPNGDVTVVSGSPLVTRSNMGAAVSPAVSDDDASGYSVGSRWIDTTGGRSYLCVDSSTGAAVWVETSPVSGGGLSGFVNVNEVAFGGGGPDIISSPATSIQAGILTLIGAAGPTSTDGSTNGEQWGGGCTAQADGVAVGLDVATNTDDSVGIGHDITIEGLNCIVLGSHVTTDVLGYSNTVAGAWITVEGDGNVVIGRHDSSPLTITSDQGVMVGNNCYAEGRGLALGQSAYSGALGVAMGHAANADGAGGIALGSSANAEIDSLAFGQGSTAQENGIALGTSSLALSHACMVGGGTTVSVHAINQMVVGCGLSSSIATQAEKSFLLRPTDGSTGGGSPDLDGGHLTLRPGINSGTGGGAGDPGEITFQYVRKNPAGVGTLKTGLIITRDNYMHMHPAEGFAVTAPVPPGSTGYFFVDNLGRLCFKGSAGTLTIIAPA